MMTPILQWKTNLDPLYLDLWNDLLKVIVVFLAVVVGHVLLRGGSVEPWLETVGIELVLFFLLGLCLYHLWLRVLLRVD